MSLQQPFLYDFCFLNFKVDESIRKGLFIACGSRGFLQVFPPCGFLKIKEKVSGTTISL